METLVSACREVMEEVTGVSVALSPSSTDCNIPLSEGIPAVCIGVYCGEGLHTRNEHLELSTLPTGLEVSILTALRITNTVI